MGARGEVGHDLVSSVEVPGEHDERHGDLQLTYEAMGLSADTGLTIFAYTAEPGTKSEEPLQLLGSWAATPVAPDIRR